MNDIYGLNHFNLKTKISFFAVSESPWELERAALHDMVSKVVPERVEGGVLVVTVKNWQTGEEQNGTVCVDYSDIKLASMFCQFLGFATGWWENDLENKKDIQ